MQYRGMKRFIAKKLTAGLLVSLILGWVSDGASAAPVITNMPHRADGTRITGSQSVPKTMPGDVAVKTKPQNPGTAVTPPAQVKPATPAVQPAIPNAEAPKPATPPAQVKPATPAVQTAPKTDAPKPATPAAQPAPKAETSKPATPVLIKPAVQTEPKPAVKAEPAKLPTKPPGLETKKAEQKKPDAPVKKLKPKKPEPEKSVYQVGDKGWKVKQAQQYLQKLGFEPGEADGRFTKSTRRALRKFQKKYKLKETGNLDNATYEELKWQTEAKEYGGNVASTKILKTAAQYKGVPYVFGGTTPRGFDCSGYVQYVFAKHGIRLTRTADTQAREGKFVSKKNLKPGDLVFFTTYEPGASHVGIYAGNNLFWNATSSRGIMLSNLTDSYWGPRYYTARRILTGNDRSR